MGGVRLRDTISGLERTTRRSVSCYISGRYPHEFRSLWKFVVCLQSGRNGLVRTPDSFPPRVRILKWNCSIWYGVQASIGGTCVLVMLRAMWPSVNNIREWFRPWVVFQKNNDEHDWNPANSLPASSGTNTRDFICFFLFWLLSLPLIWFPVHKMFVGERSRLDILSLTHSGKPSFLCSEDGGDARRSDRVPNMVHPQSAWYRPHFTPACLYPWIQSGLGNGREPHVVHQ